MSINKEDVSAAKEIFMPDEEPLMTARQKRVGPGGSLFEPTSVIATSKRVIVIMRATLGLRKDFETIPYGEIASVKLEKGVFSASVEIRILGSNSDKNQMEGKSEGEIDGLSKKDAKELADIINQKILERQEKGSESGKAGARASYKYCDHCGAKNSVDADYCVSCGMELEHAF